VIAVAKSSRPKVPKVEATRNYIVEDFKNPPRKLVLGYRTVKLPGGHLARVAIMRKEGPRGGRTKITSLWHPKSERRRAGR
jgi:hypothetical protein